MLSDLELSRRTGISRPTISGKRTKFFQTGLLTREAYVDWQKICCELMSFYHVRIRHGHDREDLSEVYQAFRKIGAPLFSYLQPGEIFGAFLSKGYPELKSRMDQELRNLSARGPHYGEANARDHASHRDQGHQDRLCTYGRQDAWCWQGDLKIALLGEVAIICSRADPASLNIFERLLELKPWQEAGGLQV